MVDGIALSNPSNNQPAAIPMHQKASVHPLRIRQHMQPLAVQVVEVSRETLGFSRLRRGDALSVAGIPLNWELP